MSDEHRINRDRRGPDDEPEETLVCPDCGEEWTDRDRYDRHRDREKRNTLRGSALGEAILEADHHLRTEYR